MLTFNAVALLVMGWVANRILFVDVPIDRRVEVRPNSLIPDGAEVL